MRLTKARNVLYTLGAYVRPKTEQERQIKAFWAAVILAIVLFSYGYFLYGS